MSIITENIDRILEERGMAKKDFYAELGITAAAYSQWRFEQSQPSIGKLYTAEPEPDETAAERLRNTLPDGWLNIYLALDKSHRRQFWARVVDSIVIQPDREVVVHLRTI